MIFSTSFVLLMILILVMIIWCFCCVLPWLFSSPLQFLLKWKLKQLMRIMHLIQTLIVSTFYIMSSDFSSIKHCISCNCCEIHFKYFWLLYECFIFCSCVDGTQVSGRIILTACFFIPCCLQNSTNNSIFQVLNMQKNSFAHLTIQKFMASVQIWWEVREMRLRTKKTKWWISTYFLKTWNAYKIKA